MTEQEIKKRMPNIADDTLLALHRIEREYEAKKLHYQTIIDTNLNEWEHRLKMTLAECGYIEEEDE